MRFKRPASAEQIGEGGYKRAYRSPTEDPEHVYTESKYSYTPEQAKSVFYLNNIAHLLFPEHTIRVRQSGADADGTLHSRTTYVDHAHDQTHQAVQSETLINNGSPADNSRAFAGARKRMHKNRTVQTFLDDLEQSGLIANFALIHRWGPQDVIIEPDGGFRFVDLDPAWEEPDEIGEPAYSEACLRFDPEKLQASIDALPEARRKPAQTYFDRLLALCAEVGVISSS